MHSNLISTNFGSFFKCLSVHNNYFLLIKMGNRKNRRSRRLQTFSPEREMSNARTGTPTTGNVALTNSNVNVQESFGEINLGTQLAEPSQTC